MAHGKEKAWLWIVAVAIVASLSFAPILRAPMIADDYYLFSPQVLENPFRYFCQSVVADNPLIVQWRPLPMLGFALESKLDWAIPVLPHCTNLLFHLITIIFMGLLIALPFSRGGSIAGSAFPSAAGMLLFGLHPQAAGAVCWIAARFDLMCAAFGTAGLYVWIRYASNSPKPWPGRIVASFLFFLAILSKEPGFSFPVAIALWESRRLFRREGYRTPAVLWDTAMVLAPVVVGLGMRQLALGEIGGFADMANRDPGLGLVFSAPFGFALSMIWPLADSTLVPRPSIYVTCVLAVGVILFWTLSRSSPQKMRCSRSLPPVALAAMLALCVLLLFPGPIRVHDILHHASSRYAYVPLTGFCICAGWGVGALQVVMKARRAVALALLMLLAALLWSQQNEIARWRKTAVKTQKVLDQAASLVPKPAKGALFCFIGENLQVGIFMGGNGASDYYTMFTIIGLPEALNRKYGRSDLQATQWPKFHPLKNIPAGAYVFVYYPIEDRLQLVAQRDSDSDDENPLPQAKGAGTMPPA